MSRTLTRVLVVLVATLSLATHARAASSADSALLDGFGIFGLEELRTRGFSATSGNVGVNLGTLYSHGALQVTAGTVAATTVRLGDGSTCQKLVADTVVKATTACGPLPDMPAGGAVLGDVDPVDACGFPTEFPACHGAAITIPHDGTQLLDPGTYGDVLVEGGGAGAGTLILKGGKYVFCGLRVSRYAKLLAKAPVEIDVNGDVAFSNLSTVGPAPGSNLGVRDFKLYVAGSRLRFARKAAVRGKLCAPNGALFVNDGATFEGCAVAKRIRTDRISVKGGCAAPLPTTTTTRPSTTITVTTTTNTTTSTNGLPTTTSSSTTTSTSSTAVSTTVTSTSTSSSTAPELCGNGTLDAGEACDGSVPGNVVCLGSPGGAVLEAECPLCTTGPTGVGCKLDCSCCPSKQCAVVTTTTVPSTTSSTIIVVTTTSTLSPTTITTTTNSLPSSTIVTTSTSPASTTSSTHAPTTSLQPTTTSSSSTTTTSFSTTTTTTSTSTSTSTSSTSTSTSTTTAPPGTTTTTTLPPQLSFTIGDGTANCGGPALSTPPAAPLSGDLRDATNTKLADLGLGCLYFGGGKNNSIPGGIIPTGSTTTFNITGQNGNAVTIGGASGDKTSCTKGTGPAKHCVKGEAGTDGLGACTSDANCANHAGSCVLDANCFFGPPLSIPNPNLVGTSTCVLNVLQNDVTGTGDLSTGAANLTMTLASRVYLTGSSYDDNTTTVIEACPRCISGSCNKGQNAGKACATTAPNLVSLDCPPLASQFLATLPIALNPFSTGQTSLANATGVFCPGQTTAPSSTANVGALGKTTARTIHENGSPAGNLNDHAAHAASLASSFCIPATGNQLIDPVAGLPGPGALSVTGTLKLQ